MVTSCGRFCTLVVVIVFLEFDLMFSVGQADYRTECVRFGYLLHRLQIAIAIGIPEDLARAVAANCRDRNSIGIHF